MRANTRLFALGGAALTVALLTGCAGAAAPTDDGATTIRFGLPTQMGANNSPMAVAQELGYFAEEGLEVELIGATDSTSIVQGVNAGNIDIGSTPPETLWQTIANGEDIELVYNYIRKQTGSIAVLADGPIDRLEDLEGGVVGQSTLGSSNLLLSNGILDTIGFAEDVDFRNLAVGTGAAALQALETDQVQALSLWDTEYAAFENGGVELDYFTTPEVEALFSTTYFTSPTFLAEQEAAVAGFGRAMAKATLFTATNPEAALRLMYRGYPNSRLAGMSEEEQLEGDLVALERRLDLLTADDPSGTGTWGRYSDEAVGAWEAFAFEAGIIPTEIDAAAHIGNDLVDAYNDFDAAEIINEAEDWTA